MSGTLRKLNEVVPGLSLRPGAQQVIPTAKQLMIANWPAITSWYSSSSFLDTVWFEHLEGRIDGVTYDNTLVTGSKPVVSQIGGVDYVVFNDTNRMNALSDAPILNVGGAWTVAFVFHGNSGTNNDYILSFPYTETAGSGNTFLQLASTYQNIGGVPTSYFTCSAQGGGGSTIFTNAGQSGNVFPRTGAVIVVIGYSPSDGYFWFFKSATGQVTGTLPTPASNQLITNGKVQIGMLGASTGAAVSLFGDLNDVMVFNARLADAQYSAQYAQLINMLEDEYL